MFLRRTIAVFLSFFCAQLVFGAFHQFPPGARTGALALTTVALPGDPTTLVENPSGLSFLQSPQFYSFYSRPYGLKELETAYLGASFSYRHFSFGAGLQQFGYALYREKTIFLGFSWKSTSRFSIGASLFLGQLRIPGFRSANVLGINLGYFFRLSPRLSLGGSIKNATHAALYPGENLPQELNTGLAYFPSKSVSFSFQVSKSTRFPASIRAGTEWRFYRWVAFRAGFLTQPARFTAGLGFQIAHFQLEYAYLTHAILGGTHQFSVSFY